MALNKQTLDLSFTQGLDTKTDPFRVEPGKFLTLENSIFDKIGRLTKRNGFSPLATLSDSSSTYLTTFQNNLTAVGDTLQAYSRPTNQWVTKSEFQPLKLTTLPLIRSNLNQSQADAVVSGNGLVCTAYTDNPPSGPAYYYVVADATTGQNIVAPTLIPASGGGTVTGSPRVFLLGNYFIVMFTNLISGTSHLQYIAISINNPKIVTAPADIAASYTPSVGLSYDGVVVGTHLYVAYNSTTGGQHIAVTYLPATLATPPTPVTFNGQIATYMSVTVDNTNASAPIIYASYYDSVSSTGYVLAVDQNLNTILAPTEWTTASGYVNVTSAAYSGSVDIYAEVANTYTYDPSIATNRIIFHNVTQAGVVGPLHGLIRSLGLASKAFAYNGASYVTGIYSSINQPTYFVMKNDGTFVSTFAYSNGGTYYTMGLPSAIITGDVVNIAYFYKDLAESVNKATASSLPSAAVYTQTGINLLTLTFETKGSSAEIGGNLNLGAGFVWAYDGYSLVEQGFDLWPDYVEVSGSSTAGSMTPQQYYYQATYEWSDNQGNIFRSAPSIPVSVTLTSDTSVTINVPTYRVTYKIANPVKIVIYRWSTMQPNYYQVTSVTTPLLNSINVDYVTFTDAQADSSIIGNNLIYTTGGVLEDIGPPSTNIMALFNNRLWLVDAEDQNLLWFSKQVIEATPVEMSDLLTLYVAPTTSAQQSTGVVTALSPMDDKLVIFKQNAVGYINGIGPDNTGANSQYSDFIIINSVIGCDIPGSIVLMPLGLMFQSAKGIWLLGRDLSTQYIGAPVESLTTGATVLSAINIPMTTQVRFTLDSGITLMYDYFYQQWGTFVNVPATSSTVYQDLHTYLSPQGQVFQETPGEYLDNSSPVLMSFTTSWISLAGVQGFERFYHFYLLGQYLSPFKLNVQLAFDFNPSPQQNVIVTPSNFAYSWGGDNAYWGNTPSWGGTPESGLEASANVFEARVFPNRQKCETFQIAVNEVYDPSFGNNIGAGLTLSGLNLVVGTKRGFRTSRASRNFG